MLVEQQRRRKLASFFPGQGEPLRGLVRFGSGRQCVTWPLFRRVTSPPHIVSLLGSDWIVCADKNRGRGWCLSCRWRVGRRNSVSVAWLSRNSCRPLSRFLSLM